MGAGASEPASPAAAAPDSPGDPVRALWKEGLASIQRGEVPSVELSGQQLGPREVRELCEVLAGSEAVKALELDGNRVGDEGAALLAQSLAGDSKLNLLDLTGNGIRDAGATALAAALGGNCALRQLDLAENRIRGPGGLALGRMLGANTGLRQLTLSWNRVGAEGARGVGLALPSNASLRILNLRKCGLGSEGAELIAQGLSAQQCGLTELSVGLNRFRDDGAAEFAKMLTVNRRLRELYVDGNRIGSLGGALIGEALMGNWCLQTIWMIDNKVDVRVVNAFTETIKVNPTLRRLGLTVDKSMDKAALQALDSARMMRPRALPASETLPPLPSDSKSEPLTADNIFVTPSAVPNASQDSRGVSQRHSHDSGSGSEADSQFDAQEFDDQQGVAGVNGVPRTARASRQGVSRASDRHAQEQEAVHQIIMYDDALDVEELMGMTQQIYSTSVVADIAAPTELPGVEAGN